MKNLKSIIVLIVFLFALDSAYAKTINVNLTQTYIEDGIYYADLEFNIELSKEAKKALLHGISLEIHTQFQLYQKRIFFWDKKVKETVFIYRLEHQPLTEDYLIVDQRSGIRRSYNNLQNALNHINSITKVILFEIDLLESKYEYNARIKTYFDIESLPLPMRPQAYFSPDWKLSSNWHNWSIKP